jgi:hypothetical protein
VAETGFETVFRALVAANLHQVVVLPEVVDLIMMEEVDSNMIGPMSLEVINV